MNIRRLSNNPIISNNNKDFLDNINGPSMIQVPSWTTNRLGNFYLYFAHHRGKYIRIAYSDSIQGPWNIYQNGCLNLCQFNTIYDHVASPDVHVDYKNRKIEMFFHGVQDKKQWTFFASSQDGINFISDEKIVSDFYFKVVKYYNYYIGISKGGQLWHSVSDNINSKYIKIPLNLFNKSDDANYNGKGDIRHCCLDIINNTLFIYYTKIADIPERIYRVEIDITKNPIYWTLKNQYTVLIPETFYEGANLPLKPSSPGMAKKPENSLRDPSILNYCEKKFLIYCGMGEHNISIAQIESL